MKMGPKITFLSLKTKMLLNEVFSPKKLKPSIYVHFLSKNALYNLCQARLTDK